MDGRRITASPRPCNGRRVVAKKRPRGGVDGFVNSVKKLQRREICSKRGRAFTMCDAQERFRNIRLQVISRFIYHYVFISRFVLSYAFFDLFASLYRLYCTTFQRG